MLFEQLPKISEIAEETNLVDQLNYFVQLNKRYLISEKSNIELLKGYETTLQGLSKEDFLIFKEKVKPLVYNKDELRPWGQLFAVFHELKGIDYLKIQGFDPNFICEDKKIEGRFPDLYDKKRGALMEVKTIYESDRDLLMLAHNTKAVSSGGMVLDEVLQSMPEELSKKIIKDIKDAQIQLNKFDSDGVYNSKFIFLCLRLDVRCDLNRKIKEEIKLFIESLNESVKIITDFL